MMQNPFVRLARRSSALAELAINEPETETRETRTDSVTARLIPDHSAIPPVARPLLPSPTPTIEELRGKAKQCQADAERSTIPELRANLLKIAAEYERLALRGEQFKAHSQNPAGRMIALNRWYS